MDNRVFTAPGEIVRANGSYYHVRRFGDRGPLFLLECGLTMMSSCWGWIAPELGGFARVLAYDRAGLGWSEEREEVRDARQLAKELLGLLEVLAVRESVVLLGHSMGSIVNRAVLRLQPGIARALVWLDPAHPEQFQRKGIRRRMRNLLFYIEAAQMLAIKGIPVIEVPLTRHFSGLSHQEYHAIRRFLRNPTHLRTCAREARAWETSAVFVSELPVGDIPLLVVSGSRNPLPGWEGLQRELVSLSRSAHRLAFQEISHTSMLANREHVQKVVAEIRRFLENLSYG